MRLVKSYSHVAIYKHEDEFIVKVPGQPAADYFTDDWKDADGTAAQMNASVKAAAAKPGKVRSKPLAVA